MLQGQKYYISGLDLAEVVIVVVARTGTDETSGRARLTLFVVDTDTPGLTFEKLPTALEIPENTFTLYLDNVRVDGDRVLGEVDHGLRAAFAGINAERLLVAATCTGIGRYALGKTMSYARERSVWSAPIGAHQAVAHPFAAATGSCCACSRSGRCHTRWCSTSWPSTPPRAAHSC